MGTGNGEGNMKFHRLAKYFPMLEGEDFDLLVESIRKNGQREPIVTYEGQILDGINRWRACQQLNVTPQYRELAEGDDPLQYVVDANVRRRHMDTSQRAMLATEMLPEFEARSEENRTRSERGTYQTKGSPDPVAPGEDHYRSRSDAAKVFGVSGPTIQRAKRVKEEAPDKVADIVSGKTTVSAVDAELREEKKKKLKKASAKTDVDNLRDMTTSATAAIEAAAAAGEKLYRLARDMGATELSGVDAMALHNAVVRMQRTIYTIKALLGGQDE